MFAHPLLLLPRGRKQTTFGPLHTKKEATARHDSLIDRQSSIAASRNNASCCGGRRDLSRRHVAPARVRVSIHRLIIDIVVAVSWGVTLLPWDTTSALSLSFFCCYCCFISWDERSGPPTLSRAGGRVFRDIYYRLFFCCCCHFIRPSSSETYFSRHNCRPVIVTMQNDDDDGEQARGRSRFFERVKNER